MKKTRRLLCMLLVVSMFFAFPVVAAEVSDETRTALESLSGTTVISWADFYNNATATVDSGKGVLTRVTDAQGVYDTYLQYEVKGITTASENSRTITYKDKTENGMSSKITAGDAMLLRMVVRSADQTGRTKVTALEEGIGTTSKPSGVIDIPTEWTEIYVPLAAGGAANMFTLRFGYFNQTVQIADLTLVNYGTAISKNELPAVSQAAAPAKAGIAKGGIAINTEMFPTALYLLAGETLFVDPIHAAEGEMVLLTLPVRAKAYCSTVTVSGPGVDMTYKVPVQWSNIYLPFISTGSLSNLTVSVDDGAVEFGAVTLENKGSATFESLALKSGMWLLEDFDEIILPESAGVKASNQSFYEEKGITSGRTSDLVISSDGNYVYSIGDGMLTVTDITDSANPKVLSKLTGLGDVAGTSSLGDTRQICLLPGKGTNGADAVIFTCRSYGAFIFDMADPAAPVELSHYDALEMATGLAVYGNYAFICNRYYGVEVVDISDPAQPVHLCTILNEGGEVQSCRVVDGILYAGEYNNNCVSIYDVKNPLEYKKLGTCNLNGRGDGMAVATVNGKTYLYAGTGHHSVSGLANSTPLSNLQYGQGNGLDIFDVTDPTNPQWLSTSKIDGRFYNTSCDFWGAECAYDETTGKSYAYLVSTFNGVYIFDVTDPKAPIRVAHIGLELLPDSANYNSYSLTNSSRAFIYNFDTSAANLPKMGAAGAVACKDGAIAIAGVSSDLYIYESKYAFALTAPTENAAVEVTGEYYNFDAFKDLQGFAAATIEGGQTYAIDELGGYIYVAAGAKGIQIYDKNLNLKGNVETKDICYDLYIQDGKMYVAEGRSGVAIYTVNGLKLTETWRWVSNIGSVTTVRPSVTGKFVMLHVGATNGQIVRVTDSQLMTTAKSASQMYHHNVTEVVAGRYMGFWANSSSERWYDFGENDSFDTPVRVTDSSSGYTPRAAMTGGITVYNGRALATNSGGYVLYDPESISSSEMAALSTIKPVDGYGSSAKVSIYGKATISGKYMVSCDRVYGRIYITDISDINKPVLLAAYGVRENTALVGNPDIALIVDGTVYIPLGYMGIVKFDLDQDKPASDVHMGGDHCICGGNVNGHDCENITWQPWGATEEERTSLPASGNYYLIDDVITTERQVKTGTLNLCLNGHTVSAKGTARVVSARTGGKVNITDCRDSGEMLAAGSNGAGGAVYLDGDEASEFTLYGGTIRGTQAISQNGGLIYSAGGTVNIHGGALCNGQVTNNGTSSKYGGNIHASGVLNITGGIIEGGTAAGDNGGNIFMAAGSELNISGGIIRNGNSTKRGRNIYVDSSASKVTEVNISGGLIEFDQNLTTTGLGGNIYANLYARLNISGGTIRGGKSGTGGNIYLNPMAKLSMTGGTIEDGYSSGNGGNVYLNAAAEMELTGGTITGGEAKTSGGNIYLGHNADYEETHGRTDAIAVLRGGEVSEGTAGGSGDNVYATGMLHLDLMGQELAGVYATANKFFCWDSATDSYDGTKAGKLIPDDGATAAFDVHWQNPETLKRYMTIENDDGSYEFHRFYVGITHLNLKPAVTGVGYKATIAGSDAVLEQIVEYGYKLWIDPDRVAVATKSGATLTNTNTVTARVQNFDVKNYGEVAVNGSVFIELQDGTVIESSVVTYTLRSIMETVSASAETYTEMQLSAVKSMVARFSSAMTKWNIDDLR